MTRLEAIWRVLSNADAHDGEFGGTEVREDAVKALHVLGVNDVEIRAAERKGSRPGAWS